MGELKKLPNIAEKLEAQLIEVGVPTVDALKQTGSREAWLRIAAIDPSTSRLRRAFLYTFNRTRSESEKTRENIGGTK